MTSKFQVRPRMRRLAAYLTLVSCHLSLSCGVVLKDPLSVMGGEQAAGVLTTVKKDQLAREGKPFSAEEENDIRRPILEKYDAEGWSSNDLAREALLARLATYPRVVLLGGDVHFAVSLTLDYYKKGVSAPVRIVQLTASPARNKFRDEVKLLLRQNAMLQLVETEYSASRLAWTESSSLVVPAGQFVSPGRRSRIKRSPSLLPAEGWPAGTAVPSDKPPEWRWRLTVQRDPRPEASLPTALRQQLLAASDELDEANALPGYQKIAGRHQTAAATRFEFLRQMVFKSNIGIVRLSKEASGNVVLSHTLISESGPDAVAGTDATVHEIPLAPSPKPPPEVEFR